MTATTEPARRPRGTAVERYGWVLLALLTAIILVFGVQAWLNQDAADTVINGSGCCNGHQLSAAPGWVYDYSVEQGRYMATFMAGMGLFGLAVVLAGLRSARRWAWAACWYVPVMFAVHGFVLGSFPFDIPTLALGVLGLLLMVRPVFGARGAPPVDEAAAAVPGAVGGARR
jgi:ATP/ADP translocase